MSSTNITSADSSFLLSVSSLWPSPLRLEGYSTDTAFTTDSVAPAEAQMGVDGRMTAGYTPHMHKQKISLQADSPSVKLFDAWYEAQDANRTVYFANATIIIPGIGKSYTLSRGALTNYKQIPDAKKVLQAVEYEITWESITKADL